MAVINDGRKLGALPAATSLSDANMFHVLQGTVDKRSPLTLLYNWLSGKPLFSALGRINETLIPANYELKNTDNGTTFIYSGSGFNSITLLEPALFANGAFTIKHIGTGILTVDGTVDGVASMQLFNGDSICIYSNGALWRSLFRNGSGDNVGIISYWGGTIESVPSHSIYCDGRSLLISEEPRLYARINTMYGVGDGPGTFRAPRSVGKVIIGAEADVAGRPKVNMGDGFVDSGGSIYHNHGGSTAAAGSHNHTGKTIGHALSVPEIPAHDHSTNVFSGSAGGTYGSEPYEEAGLTGGSRTGSTGGGQPHTHDLTADGQHIHIITSTNHLPPFITHPAIIRRY